MFNDQRWMMRRVATSNYTYDGYIADLLMAWQDVMHRAKKQVEASQQPTYLADCIRFALISTSINALAQNYVPVLVARAIEKGVWSANRGLSLAAKLPVFEAYSKYKFYQVIIETLNGEQREKAIQGALETALAISNELARVYALSDLAGQLSGEQVDRALEAARATSNQIIGMELILRLLQHHLPTTNGQQRIQSAVIDYLYAVRIINRQEILKLFIDDSENDLLTMLNLQPQI